MGKYRVTRRLAEGGMGEIFLGHSRGRAGFQKVVVLKRILADKLGDRVAVQMFLDEARLMATLNHANIVQVHDVGTQRGAHFFVMEHVHGEDLRAILQAATLAGRPVSLEMALGVIAEVAAGLHHAHEMRGPDGVRLQIVHRDISPSNVLVSYEGAVKVTDFGIAKWTKRQTETQQGVLKGKIAYMSPEQCRGDAVDRRSDVFGLGILLYELTTGARLFQGISDFAVLDQIVHHDAPPPSSKAAGYPPAVERIVMRALCRDPARRQQSARELQLELEEYARERRLKISAVARAAEMQAMFGDKILAWRQALKAGRSLGEHLATERTVTRPESPGSIRRQATAQPPRTNRRRASIVVTFAAAAGACGLMVLRSSRGARSSARLAPVSVTSVTSVASVPEPLPSVSVSPPPPMPPSVPSAPAARIRGLQRARSHHRLGVAPDKDGRSASASAASAAPSTPTAATIWDPDSMYLP
jgi:serine/threonine protein kinase